MRKRILSFILVLVMMLTMIPVLETEAKALELKYTDLKLNVNWDHIKSVGKQAPNSVSCACYALAYSRTLLDGTVHRYSEYNLGTNEYDAYCSWSKGSHYGKYPTSHKEALQILYSELCNGNPVIAWVEGSRSYHHYITIVGFEGVKSINDLQENNFLIIDPAVSGYNLENMGKVGYKLKLGSSYQLWCDKTDNTVKFEAKEPCEHNYNDVGVCTSTCKKEYNFMASKNTGVAGIYKTTDKITLRTDKPYTASNNKSKDSIAKGKEVTVEYCVTNHYGNTWYYITYKDLKGYVYEDRLKFVKHFDQKITCEITSPAENQSLTKKAHPLIGTVTSTYPIAIINGYLDGQHFVDTKPNATTVDLRSSVINTCLDFGKLSPGKHTLELKAHDIHRKDDISIIKRTFYIEAIGPHTCDKGEYLWVWDVHPHYKCYKCSICGEEWANKSEPTVREGCSDCYPPTCKVSLNTNGGSCDKKELIVTDGSNIGDLPTPTLSGYAFDGWYTEPFGGSKITSSTKVTDNMTVYAHWKHAGHKIEFDFADGIRKDAGEVAQLTSINNGRPGGALVVFNEGGTTVNTNVYGWEIAVDEYGAIKAVRKYGDSTQLQVPYGGFVLSGQADSTPGVEGIFGGVLTVINIHEENLNYVYVDYETGKVYAYENYADYVANHKYVADGENYGVLPVPKREGDIFVGWTSDKMNGERIGYFSTDCGTTLKAVWVDKEEAQPMATSEMRDHYYEYYEFPMSWEDANAFCVSKGGHLVTISGLAEQSHVYRKIYFMYKGLYYIGCSDAENEGTWKWITGEAFDYKAWDTDSDNPEPTGNDKENYGAIIAIDNPPNKSAGEWIDSPNVNYGSFYDISNCGFVCEYDNAPCVHSYKFEVTSAPTLTNTGTYKAVCELCEDSLEVVLPALNPTDYRYTSEIAPTCDMEGWDGYYWKDNNGADFVFDVYPPATGHDAVLKNAKEATCTADGYTGDKVCKTCGTVTKQGEVIKATDHKWDEGKVIKKPTETSEGTKLFTCTACKETKEESIPVTTHKHTFKETVVAPSCTEGGYTLHECKCGESFKDSFTDALGHTPELKNEKAATCTTDGYTGDEICKTCDKTIKSGDVIKATGHKWDEGKVTKEPNETTEGIKQFTCTVCEETKEESIPVTTHKHTFKDTVVAPSCTEGGYTLHECSCSESYKDTYTNALGHTPELKNEKAAACTVDGYTGDEICKTCGKTIKSGEVIKAKGHSYANGKCSVCGAADPNYEEPKPEKPIVNPFNDVKESDWFYAPVLWAVQNNVTGGTSPNTFGPNNFCTRAQVVTFLWAANGKPEPTSMNNPFTDVSDNAWYCKAVMWAVEQGITGGTSATTFSPDAYCTRAQVATFLYAAQGKPAVQNANNEFIDVPNNAWYLNPVLWAAENGITGGIGGGKFGPDQTCTRAQIATFLYKAMS